METATPFDLNLLQRDWIEGVPGDAFYMRVQRRMAIIRKSRIAAQTRGVMILERDAIQFAAAFFAATYLRVPVILANRRWGRVEWEEVGGLVNPAVIFGNCPITTRKRKGILNPGPASILIPTGGSSGGVKFAVHKWEALVTAWEGLSGLLGPGPMHWCCVLPLFHVSGLMQLMRAFLSGGRIDFPEFKDLQAGYLPDFGRGTLCLSLVPTQLQRLMMQKRIADRLMGCRAIFIGGAPVPGSVEARARELHLPLVLSYGMTETAAMVSALPPDEFLAGHVNAGRPFSHAKVEVVCDGTDVCPVGVTGRIRIKGRSLFKGYHARSGQPVTRDGYLTGDEGYFDPDGRLHIVGRADRLIISGGEKIDPQEVEEVILQTGAVEQVLVIGWPDPEWGQKLVAFYTTAGVESSAAHWEAEMRADLANYKIPKQMIRVGLLPLNAHGKIDRKLIESLLKTCVEIEG